MSAFRILRTALAGLVAAALSPLLPPGPAPAVVPAGPPVTWVGELNGSIDPAAAPRLEGFWISGDGLCLNPKATGTAWLEPPLRLTAPGRMDLTLWAERTGGDANRLQISVDGGRTYVTAARDVSGAGVLIHAALPIPADVRPMLRFDARSTSADQRLMLDRLRVTLVPSPPAPAIGSRWTRATMLIAAALVCGWWPWPRLFVDVQARRRRLLPAIAASIAVAVGVIAAAAALGDLLAERPPRRGATDQDLTAGAVTPPLRLIAADGAMPCPDGWCLNGHSRGRILMDVVLPAGTGIGSLSLWFHPPPGGGGDVSVSNDGGRRFKRLRHDTDLNGESISLPPDLFQIGGPVRLQFEGVNSGPNQSLLLDKAVLVFTERPVPALPTAGWLLCAIGLAGFGMTVLLPGNRRAAAVTCAILLVAAFLRYGALVDAADRPLDPDAGAFRAYGERMAPLTPTGFYSAQFREREPGYVLAIHTFFQLAGDSDLHLRVLSVLLSIAVVYATMRLAAARITPAAAPLAGLAVALCEPLVAESVRGLRLELEMVLWLVFLGVVTAKRDHLAGKPWAWGLAGAALVLTRSSYLPTAVVLILLAAWRTRDRWSARASAAAAAVAIIVVLMLPHRLAMYRIHGDAFWDTSMYARWLANFEFTGRPGFPTRAALMQNGYLGPRLTYRDYLFGMHSMRELAAGTARGMVRMTSAMRPFMAHEGRSGLDGRALIDALFQVTGVVGLAIALVTGAPWLPVAFVMSIAPIAFLYDRGLLEGRHALQAYPLLVFAALYLVTWASRRLLPDHD